MTHVTSDIDTEMIASVRRFLETECPIGLVRNLYGGEDPRVHTLWEGVAAMGLNSALLDEDADGLGLGMRVGVRLAEEAGRVLLPLPLSPIMALIPFLLPALRDTAHPLAAIVEDCRAGESWLGVATPLSQQQWFAEYVEAGWSALAFEWKEDFLCAGTIHPASVSSGLDGSIRTARVDRSQPLCDLAMIPCDAVQWSKLRSRIRVLRLAEAVGIADKALEQAIGYACEREQFGRAIGANQSIKHRLADHWMMVDNARLAVHHAAELYDHDADTELAIAYAQILVVEAARSVTQYALQVFGALGITWECDAHLFLKRAQYFCAILEHDRPVEALLEEIWTRT